MEQEEKKELKSRQNVETEAPIPRKDSPDAAISTEGREKRVSRIHVETAVALGERSSSGLSRQEDVTDKVVSLIKDSKGKTSASEHEVKLESGKNSGRLEAAKQADAPTRPKSEYSMNIKLVPLVMDIVNLFLSDVQVHTCFFWQNLGNSLLKSILVPLHHKWLDMQVRHGEA
jgi:hypothetical protein